LTFTAVACAQLSALLPRLFRQAFEAYFELKRQGLSNAKHLAQWPATMETYTDFRRDEKRYV
jgi:hypothetical protein